MHISLIQLGKQPSESFMRVQTLWMFFPLQFGLGGILEVTRVTKKQLTFTRKSINIFYIPSMEVLAMWEGTQKTPLQERVKSKPMVGKKQLYNLMFLV